MEIKPCRKCGSVNRGPGGKCRDCERAREERKRRLAGIPKRTRYIGPCKKCNSDVDVKDGICRKCRISYSKEYYMVNKETLNIKKKEYAILNRDSINNKKKEWEKNNKEKLASYAKKYLSRNKEKRAVYAKKWREENKEKLRLLCINRRRRIYGSGKLSLDIASKVGDLQKWKCATCRISISGNYHIDHIMPISLGGSNVDSNIQLLCPHCNLSKHAKHPIDFMQSKGYLL